MRRKSTPMVRLQLDIPAELAEAIEAELAGTNHSRAMFVRDSIRAEIRNRRNSAA